MTGTQATPESIARPDLTTTIGPLRMKNPVTVASGTYGYGADFRDFYDPSRLGAIFLKGVTPLEREGNYPQRLVETPSGLINAIGLQNVGVERFIREKLPALEEVDTLVIANICGFSLEDYVALGRRMAALDRVDAVEINISCPNVERGCIEFGSDPALAAEVTRAVREVYSRPLIVKLSPNVTDIAAMARAVEEAGADALSVANTWIALAINIETRRPKLANVTGGLSGPAIRPLALRMVWECAKAVKIPIIGQGGIDNWKDAVEFFLAGADAVSVGTANFRNPTAPIEILDGLTHWLSEKACASIQEIVGTLELP